MSSGFFWLIVIVLLGIVIYLVKVLMQIRHERDRLKQDLRQYDSLISKEETEKQLDSNIQLKQNELQYLNIQQKDLQNATINLKSKLRELEAKEYLISEGNYDPKYDFVNSSDYRQRLKQIEVMQKEMRNNGRAFVCDKEWTMGEGKRGKKKGEKMTKDVLKIIEIAFEAICKYAIKEVTYNNVNRLKNKINTNYKNINNYSQKLGCRISEEYLKLKLIELELKYEFEDKKQEERERENEIKKQEKERKNIDKAKQMAQEAESRERLHQKELDQVRQELEKATQAEIEKRKQLELTMQQLEQKIAEDRRDKEKANKGKSGYIFVVSNIRSLKGENMYRICMTNRAKPDEYVRDMNPAVPFRFDVNFKIYSEDVFNTIEKLHNRFKYQRINQVNYRKDFFKVSLDEIKEAVEEIKEQTGIIRIDEFKR